MLATLLSLAPPLARAQTAEPAASRDAGSEPPASGGNAGPPGEAAVDLQRQINDLRSDLLDEREKRIDSRQDPGRLGPVVLGVALAIGILWASRKFKALPARPGNGAVAAFGGADSPLGLLPQPGTPRMESPAGQVPVRARIAAGRDSGGTPSPRVPGEYHSGLAPELESGTEAGPPPLLAFESAAAQERSEEAIADCTEAIRLDPCAPRPYLERGDARAELGLYEEAIADFDRAISLDPGNAAAYLRRCYAKAEAGRDDEAIEDLDRALRLDPDIAAEPGD